MLHFLTDHAVAHDATGQPQTTFRHRSFFVGQDMRAAVRQGLADSVPISLARVLKLMAIGRIPVDAALIQVSMPDEFGYFSQGLSVDVIPSAVARARLVIAVRCGADDRQGLEQLCRYITRPDLANERVQTNATGQVVLKLMTPSRNGTTHLVLRRNTTDSPVDCLCQPKGPSSARARPASLSPLAFMQRLAALVPRPKLHLTLVSE